MICNKCNNNGVLNTILGKDFYYCRTCKDEIGLEFTVPNVTNDTDGERYILAYDFYNHPYPYFKSSISSKVYWIQCASGSTGIGPIKVALVTFNGESCLLNYSPGYNGASHIIFLDEKKFPELARLIRAQQMTDCVYIKEL